MVIVVCAVIVIAMLVIAWSLVTLVRRALGGGGTVTQPSATPYGGLPGLGPVGALGELFPDADIADPAADSRDLYGQ
jgi:hypothetical protein